MKRLAEIAVFGGVAVGLHLAVLIAGAPAGSESQGSQGQAVVSLQAAPQEVAAVIKDWMRPPDADVELQTDLAVPSAPPTAPEMPEATLDLPPALRAPVQIARASTPSQLPNVDTMLPAPVQPVAEPVARKQKRPKPKSKPTPTTKRRPASATQRSAGVGGGAQAGTLGKTQTKTLTKGQRARLVAGWGGKVRSRIERKKRYPKGTRKTGQVTVRLRVARSGALLSSRVIRSSGVSALDQAALTAVARAAPFARAPGALRDKSYSFSLAIRFSR